MCATTSVQSNPKFWAVIFVQSTSSPPELDRGKRAGGTRGRTMHGSRRRGTDMVALPITGRTLTFVRVGTGILHDVQGSCGDGTTGSTTTTTNTVTTANRLSRVERKANKKECDTEREQHNQRSISFLLLRGRGDGRRSAGECRFFVHHDNVVVNYGCVRFSFRCFERFFMGWWTTKQQQLNSNTPKIDNPTDLDTSKHTSSIKNE